MTSSDFKQARFALGLSTSEMGEALCVETRTIQRYEDGSRDVPGSVERLVHVLLHSAQARELCGLKAYPRPTVAASE